MATKEELLVGIASTNNEKCNFPQLLDAVEITVSTMPNINLYIFELVQNSLDCGASEVKFKLGQNKGTAVARFLSFTILSVILAQWYALWRHRQTCHWNVQHFPINQNTRVNWIHGLWIQDRVQEIHKGWYFWQLWLEVLLWCWVWKSLFVAPFHSSASLSRSSPCTLHNKNAVEVEESWNWVSSFLAQQE